MLSWGSVCPHGLMYQPRKLRDCKTSSDAPDNVQVDTQAPMAGKALLLAGVLALACVASASVQSIELDHEGKCTVTYV